MNDTRYDEDDILYFGEIVAEYVDGEWRYSD